MNTTEHITNKGQGTTQIPNKLANEKSPYLLQHAYNPVKWYPWGEEAFTKAQKENKPIFLSIGYSCCHWCHVMERESFEDLEAADYLNRYFISIKVDREERPDIDSVYMTVCQNMTGSGGWPLSVFLLPDKRPFFAGTYFPKQSRYGMPGFMDLLGAIREKWENSPLELEQTGEAVMDFFNQEQKEQPLGGTGKEEIIRESVHSLLSYFDKEWGGFGREPKFPSPHNLMYLMRIYHMEGKPEVREAVEKTLDSMYAGGIFDHIGYGFSRYSTDRKWLVPHFEKMLYDNSLLAITYLEAYQLTKNPSYKQIGEMILEYVLRELTDEEGGFYCAQDADSEGVEGKYYVFTPEEILGILGEEDGNYFNQYYGITKDGNFEGKSIPNRLHREIYTPLETERISALRKKVYEYRLGRTQLHKDDKILTSWNALMITSFAKAYRILGKEKYLKAALEGEKFLRERLSDGKHLFVHYRDKKATGTGHVDDYSFYAWALISLYEGTLEPEYLKRALDNMNVLLEEFFDEERGGFYLYGKEGEALIHRPKELYDSALPSGNSVGAYVLEKLAAYTGNSQILLACDKQMNYIMSHAADYPAGCCFSLMAVLLDACPAKELVCVLKEEEEKKKLQDLLSGLFLPDLAFLVKTTQNSETWEEITDFMKDYGERDGETTYYLCENGTCKAPFHGLEKLEELLIEN